MELSDGIYLSHPPICWSLIGAEAVVFSAFSALIASFFSQLPPMHGLIGRLSPSARGMGVGLFGLSATTLGLCIAGSPTLPKSQEPVATLSSEHSRGRAHWRSVGAQVRCLGGRGAAPTKTLIPLHWCELFLRDAFGERRQFFRAVRRYRDATTELPLLEWLATHHSHLALRPLEYFSQEQREASRIRYCPEQKIWRDARGEVINRQGTLFVVDVAGRIYVVDETRARRHSTLLAGAACRCAGELRIEEGILKAFSLKSGHYHPDEVDTYDFLRELRRLKITLDGVRIPPYSHMKLTDDLQGAPLASDMFVELHRRVGGLWTLRRMAGFLHGRAQRLQLKERSYAIHPGEKGFELVYCKEGQMHRRRISRQIGDSFVDVWFLQGDESAEPHPQILIDRLLEREGGGFRAWNALPS